jgi:predicted tellurium resistance membrane protein TerC
MDRFPIIITLGAALLGWVAGDMAVTDPVDQGLGRSPCRVPALGAPLAGAIAVVVVGKWLAARRPRQARRRGAARRGRAGLGDRRLPPPPARRRRLGGSASTRRRA